MLRSHLAQEATALTHAVVERNADNASESIIIRHFVTPTDTQTVEIIDRGQ